MWQKTDFLLKRRLNQHGLTGLVEAGLVCRQAELLYPGLFRAVSLRNASLHLELSRQQILAFKMVEGKLLTELGSFVEEKNLPPVERIRLTFSRE